MFVSNDCYLDMFISQFQIWLEFPLFKIVLISPLSVKSFRQNERNTLPYAKSSLADSGLQ